MESYAKREIEAGGEPGTRRQLPVVADKVDSMIPADHENHVAALRAELEQSVERAAEGGPEDLAAVIERGERLLRALPPGDPERAYPLYILGLAHLTRFDSADGGGSAADRRKAIFYLRAVRAFLPWDDPGRIEVAVWLGLALSHRMLRHLTGANRYLSETINELRIARRARPVDPKPHALIRYRLGMMLTYRYLFAVGDSTDRTAAITELTATIDAPETDSATADSCRLTIAYLELAAEMPAELRGRSDEIPADVMERLREKIPAERRAELGAAMAHQLDGISESTEDASPLASMIPLFRALAIIQQGSGDPSLEDVDQAIAHLDEALRHETPGTADAAGLVPIRSALYATRGHLADRPEDTGRAIDELTEAMSLLRDHPLRALPQDLLGAMAAQDTKQARSKDEFAAVAERLERVLKELPDDHPARSPTVTRLATSLVQATPTLHAAAPLERVRVLLHEAIDRGTSDETNDAANHLTLGKIDGLLAFLNGDAERVDLAIARVKETAERLSPGHVLTTLVEPTLSVLLMQRYGITGDLANLDAASDNQQQAPHSEDPHRQWLSRFLSGGTKLFRNQNRLDAESLDELIEEFEAGSRQFSEGYRHEAELKSMLGALRMMRSSVDGDFPPPGPWLEEFRAGAEAVVNPTGPPDGPFNPSEYDGAAAMAMVGTGFATRDFRQLGRGITVLGMLCSDPASPTRDRVQLLGCLGTGLRMRHELNRSPRDLGNAIARLEEARRLAQRVPGLSNTASIFNTLGECYFKRRNPDLRDSERAVTTGLEGLRARAQDVLLQTGAGRALDAAISATGEAAEVARWCVAAGDHHSAVRALEYGRAMVLHSATIDAGVSDLLRDNGYRELAREWEEEPVAGDMADLPSDLRRRVLLAVDGTDTEKQLLSPPSIADIAAALRNSGTTAMVYLLPRDEQGAGMAVIVRPDQRVHHLTLPELSDQRGGVVEVFEQAQREVQRSESEAAWRRWETAAAELCEWAWTAAMEPVLGATITPHIRPARLVLLPVGKLGAVPWHAARREVAGGVRYVCQDTIVSYAASARQFVDTGGRTRRPWDSAPALVEVPEGRLFWASEEMAEIGRYYPAARHIGADGVTRTSDVRTLLPSTESAGASVLHLGCHGYRADLPVDSYLKLGDGAKLRVRDILRQARGRPTDAPGGLVVLATCVSDLTHDSHDEALTLATAFLAAGAVGVLGARWPVHDVPTALFMIMFHHYLNSGYEDPATALRATQLWMLDANRRLPAGVEGLLADELDSRPLETVGHWAAFTYQGQ